MSRSELTPEERDELSEDELIAYDLGHVHMGRGVSEASTARLVRDRVHKERLQKAQDAADDALAAEVNSTRTDLREARAERAAAEAERRSLESRRAAKAAVGGVAPRQAGTQAARQAVIARRDRNRTRARELHEDGLSAAQIARRMTAERNARLLPDDPRRPDIALRTVQRWVAD